MMITMIDDKIDDNDCLDGGDLSNFPIILLLKIKTASQWPNAINVIFQQQPLTYSWEVIAKEVTREILT